MKKGYMGLLLAWILAGMLPVAAARRPPERPVDINSATATELMQLPRVGARTAERILAWRQAHGRFRRLEDLLAVKGIGEKAFLRLRPHITLGGGEPAPEGGGPATAGDRQ
jgi:competence protein ComEA